MAVFTYPQIGIATTGLATEATLASLEAKVATETTLASIDGKDFATQTTLASIDGKDFATQTTLAALLTELQLKADLTETQPVSAASLPLPSGAATEATLASIDGKDFATQTTLAALLTELQLKADLSETQPVSAASLPLPTGAATEATLASIDGKDFATQTTLAALLTELQLKADLSETQPVSAASLPLPTGAATSANQTTANASLSSIEFDVAPLDVVDQIDTTPLLDVSSTNIPASASLPVEIVASLAENVTELEVIDDIGEYIGLYTGAASSEVLQTILPLGGGRVKVQLSQSDRVSLRHMKNTAITSDFIAINFLG